MASTDKNDEFFIGYDPPMPPRIASFVRRAVVTVSIVATAGAVVVVLGHRRLAGGAFEFGHQQTFQGVIREHPYPALWLDGTSEAERMPLLVTKGKHGADSIVRGMDGRHVTLSGTRIERDRRLMIELGSGDVALDERPAGSSAVARALATPGTPLTLTGEIVDSKCFLGVMVPGQGQTHKDCASLCLRGGIPPALYVEDRDGRSSLLLLTGVDGEPIGDKTLAIAGQTVTITGTVTRENGWLVFRTGDL